MVDWENLGIGFGVFSATLLIIVLLFYAMRRCFSRHNHVFQLLLTFIFSIGVIVSVYEAFGYQMAASLLTGLGISRIGTSTHYSENGIWYGVRFYHKAGFTHKGREIHWNSKIRRCCTYDYKDRRRTCLHS